MPASERFHNYFFGTCLFFYLFPKHSENCGILKFHNVWGKFFWSELKIVGNSPICREVLKIFFWKYDPPLVDILFLLQNCPNGLIAAIANKKVLDIGKIKQLYYFKKMGSCLSTSSSSDSPLAFTLNKANCILIHIRSDN